MKKFITVLLALTLMFTTLSMVSCDSGKDKDPEASQKQDTSIDKPSLEKGISAKGLYGAILSAKIDEDRDETIYDIIPALFYLEDEQVENEKLYGIDISILYNYKIGYAVMDTLSDEIAIVKVKDEKDIDFIKNQFKKRADNIASYFDDPHYRNDIIQNEKAVNALIVSKDNYVIMIICEHRDRILEVFNSTIESENR